VIAPWFWLPFLICQGFSFLDLNLIGQKSFVGSFCYIYLYFYDVQEHFGFHRVKDGLLAVSPKYSCSLTDKIVVLCKKFQLCAAWSMAEHRQGYERVCRRFFFLPQRQQPGKIAVHQVICDSD
jgi:hypothetical protein